MYSLIIPVFKNEPTIDNLVDVISEINDNLGKKLEIIFVVDASPDQSLLLLENKLNQKNLNATVLLLSKNFGSFAAIRAGMAEAKGPYFAVMAADLQEPPELILQFFKTLATEPCDIVIGTRAKRKDPILTRLTAKIFWTCYRHLVQKDIPPNGVDVFGCNLTVKEHLLNLNESNSTLVGLLFWLGFRRKFISYVRLAREHGKSAWSFRRKLRYLTDSIFAFSDLPIQLLIGFGILGLSLSIPFSLFVFISRVFHWITFPGYATTIMLLTFFSALNSFGLGVIGSYVWRAFENSKGRPQSIVMYRKKFNQEFT